MVVGLAAAALGWFAFYYPLLTWQPIEKAEMLRRVWYGEAWL